MMDLRELSEKLEAFAILIGAKAEIIVEVPMEHWYRYRHHMERYNLGYISDRDIRRNRPRITLPGGHVIEGVYGRVENIRHKYETR